MRSLFALIIVCASLVVAGCGGSGSSAPKPATPSTTPAETPAEGTTTPAEGGTTR